MKYFAILFMAFLILQGCTKKNKDGVIDNKEEISLSVRGIKLGINADSLYYMLEKDTTVTDLERYANGKQIEFLSFLYDGLADKHEAKFVIDVYNNKVKRIQFTSSSFNKYGFEPMYTSKYGPYNETFSQRESLTDISGYIWEWKNQRLLVSIRDFDGSSSFVSSNLLNVVREKGYKEHSYGCRAVYEDKDIIAEEEEDIRKEKEREEMQHNKLLQEEREKNRKDNDFAKKQDF